MKSLPSLVSVCVVIGILLAPAQAARLIQEKQSSPPDLNNALMRSTFLIEGKTSATQVGYGTAFLVGRQLKKDPNRSAFVLVTAKHVLEMITENTATLHFRVKDSAGVWHRNLVSIDIRSSEGPLWKAHPSADVVALYVRLPANRAGLEFVPADLLASDEMLAEMEVHPGDEVNCLGFPFGVTSNEAGFPVLRSGKLSSFPLLPTKTVKTFLIDFAVCPGNSGGPVYLVSYNRFYAGNTHLGFTQMILGLVIEERFVHERVSERGATTDRKIFLNLAEVVHASTTRLRKRSSPTTFRADTADLSKTDRDCRLIDAKVRFFADNLAMVYGSESSVRKAKDGTQNSRCLIWTDTWLKRNGTWQIVAAQDTQFDCK
jgi:hypothetical protein